MKNKKEALFFLLVFTSVLITTLTLNSVTAFGVTSPYWNEQPLYMAPGETTIVSFELQNMVGVENITVQAQLVNGTEIAKLLDASNIYLIPIGTKNTKVNIKINIPAEASIGSTYKIGVSFDTINPQNGGIITGSGVEKSFNVIISQTTSQTGTSKTPTSILIILIVIIVVLILLFIILQALKKKSKSKKV